MCGDYTKPLLSAIVFGCASVLVTRSSRRFSGSWDFGLRVATTLYIAFNCIAFRSMVTSFRLPCPVLLLDYNKYIISECNQEYYPVFTRTRGCSESPCICIHTKYSQIITRDQFAEIAEVKLLPLFRRFLKEELPANLNEASRELSKVNVATPREFIRKFPENYFEARRVLKEDWFLISLRA